MPFVYDQQALKQIGVALSADRMSKYLIATKGDWRLAIALYEENTRLSESFYGVLQAFEVAARNAIHDSLSNGLQRPDWYDALNFGPLEEKTLADARSKLRQWNKAETPGRVVAELTFGFWVRLLAPQYEKQLWVKHLYKAFPHLARPDRVTVFNRFERIRKLRNRIAHHEAIYASPLDLIYTETLEAIGWICPVTAAWVNSSNTFTSRRFR